MTVGKRRCHLKKVQLLYSNHWISRKNRGSPNFQKLHAIKTERRRGCNVDFPPNFENIDNSVGDIMDNNNDDVHDRDS